MDNRQAIDFHTRLKGNFQGLLQWQQLDVLWGKVKAGEWYVYQLGEALPPLALHGDALAHRIDALNELLHKDHAYDYCGIVYADDVNEPTLIKVYDPNHIGSSCGCSDTPSPPGWILSIAPPALIEPATPTTASRKRWWQLFS